MRGGVDEREEGVKEHAHRTATDDDHAGASGGIRRDGGREGGGQGTMRGRGCRVGGEVGGAGSEAAELE